MMQIFCTIKTKLRQGFPPSQASETHKDRKKQNLSKKMKLSVAFMSAAVANNIQAGTGFAPGTLQGSFTIELIYNEIFYHLLSIQKYFTKNHFIMKQKQTHPFVQARKHILSFEKFFSTTTSSLI